MSLTNAKLVSLKDQLEQDERDLKAELEAVEKEKAKVSQKEKKSKKGN